MAVHLATRAGTLEVRSDGEAMARFGHGLKALEAVARDL
jgi:hypothetical protein